MGARIMAVADIFSAVAEIRPYREGMSKDQVVEILRSSASAGALSSYIVDLLVNNYEDIYEKRDIEVRNEGARYYAAIVDSE
jgi:HD-GYP domain-containing protein (c-di-GMP phosphodiesterase class II)